MKKIISIILGILLMFSMSVTSFAGFVEDVSTTTVTTEAPVIEKLNIKVTAKIDAAGTIPAEEGSLVTYTGRKCTFTIAVTNNTTTSMSGAIINDFAPSFTDKKTGAALTIYDVKGDGFGDNSPAETGISKGETKEFTYVAYIATADKVNVSVTCLGVTKTFEVTSKAVSLDFVWKIDEEITEDDTTSTTTPETTIPDTSDEDTTTDDTTTTTQPAPEVTDPVVDTPEVDTTPEKEPADVDDIIPDTGATVPFAAIGTLVTSAITALVAKKKKEN